MEANNEINESNEPMKQELIAGEDIEDNELPRAQEAPLNHTESHDKELNDVVSDKIVGVGENEIETNVKVSLVQTEPSQPSLEASEDQPISSESIETQSCSQPVTPMKGAAPARKPIKESTSEKTTESSSAAPGGSGGNNLSTEQLMEYIKKQKTKLKKYEVLIAKYESANQVHVVNSTSKQNQRLAAAKLIAIQLTKLVNRCSYTPEECYRHWKDKIIRLKLQSITALEQKNSKLKALLSKTHTIHQKSMEDSNMLKQRQQEVLLELKHLKEKEDGERVALLQQLRMQSIESAFQHDVEISIQKAAEEMLLSQRQKNAIAAPIVEPPSVPSPRSMTAKQLQEYSEIIQNQENIIEELTNEITDLKKAKESQNTLMIEITRERDSLKREVTNLQKEITKINKETIDDLIQSRNDIELELNQVLKSRNEFLQELHNIQQGNAEIIRSSVQKATIELQQCLQVKGEEINSLIYQNQQLQSQYRSIQEKCHLLEIRCQQSVSHTSEIQSLKLVISDLRKSLSLLTHNTSNGVNSTVSGSVVTNNTGGGGSSTKGGGQLVSPKTVNLGSKESYDTLVTAIEQMKSQLKCCYESIQEQERETHQNLEQLQLWYDQSLHYKSYQLLGCLDQYLCLFNPTVLPFLHGSLDSSSSTATNGDHSSSSGPSASVSRDLLARYMDKLIAMNQQIRRLTLLVENLTALKIPDLELAAQEVYLKADSEIQIAIQDPFASLHLPRCEATQRFYNKFRKSDCWKTGELSWQYHGESLHKISLVLSSASSPLIAAGSSTDTQVNIKSSLMNLGGDDLPLVSSSHMDDSGQIYEGTTVLSFQEEELEHEIDPFSPSPATVLHDKRTLSRSSSNGSQVRGSHSPVIIAIPTKYFRIINRALLGETLVTYTVRVSFPTHNGQIQTVIDKIQTEIDSLTDMRQSLLETHLHTGKRLYERFHKISQRLPCFSPGSSSAGQGRHRLPSHSFDGRRNLTGESGEEEEETHLTQDHGGHFMLSFPTLESTRSKLHQVMSTVKTTEKKLCRYGHSGTAAGGGGGMLLSKTMSASIDHSRSAKNLPVVVNHHSKYQVSSPLPPPTPIQPVIFACESILIRANDDLRISIPFYLLPTLPKSSSHTAMSFKVSWSFELSGLNGATNLDIGFSLLEQRKGGNFPQIVPYQRMAKDSSVILLIQLPDGCDEFKKLTEEQEVEVDNSIPVYYVHNQSNTVGIIVLFDNSYSYFKSKQLKYHVSIEPYIAPPSSSSSSSSSQSSTTHTAGGVPGGGDGLELELEASCDVEDHLSHSQHVAWISNDTSIELVDDRAVIDEFVDLYHDTMQLLASCSLLSFITDN